MVSCHRLGFAGQMNVERVQGTVRVYRGWPEASSLLLPP